MKVRAINHNAGTQQRAVISSSHGNHFGRFTSNETELSHRWRDRALLRRLVLKSSES